MKIISDKEQYKGKFIRMIDRKFIDMKEEENIWEMVERVNQHGHIVMIAALTDQQEVILTRIFRVPLKSFVLELPAGLSDIKGETEEETARRELLEETGYEVKTMERIITGPFDAGLTPHQITLFLGKNAKKVQSPQLDPSEEIEVVKVSVDHLVDYIKQTNDLVDMKITSFLPYL